MSEHKRCRFNIHFQATMTSLNYVLARKLLKVKSKKQNGFTLIELMVVIAIVGVLTAVGLPELSKAQDKAEDASAKATLTNAAKECSLDLVTGESPYDFSGTFADVTSNGSDGECEEGATIALYSESGDGATTQFEIEFTGAIPGIVKEAE